MNTSVRSQPLLAVRDVRASARWYATLLGAARTSELMASDHDHLYDRLLVNGALVIQLHAWDAEDHPNLVDPDGGRAMFVGLFASEEDLRASEPALEAMDPPEGMGQRASVAVYEVGAEVRM